LKGRSKEGLGEVMKNKKLQQGYPSFAFVVVSSSCHYRFFFILVLFFLHGINKGSE
jgi:hypothetical protein